MWRSFNERKGCGGCLRINFHRAQLSSGGGGYASLYCTTTKILLYMFVFLSQHGVGGERSTLIWLHSGGGVRSFFFFHHCLECTQWWLLEVFLAQSIRVMTGVCVCVCVHCGIEKCKLLGRSWEIVFCPCLGLGANDTRYPTYLYWQVLFPLLFCKRSTRDSMYDSFDRRGYRPLKRKVLLLAFLPYAFVVNY